MIPRRANRLCSWGKRSARIWSSHLWGCMQVLVLLLTLSALVTALGLTTRNMLHVSSAIRIGRSYGVAKLFSTAGGLIDKKRVVFLGTPSVAAESLQHLHDASLKTSTTPFEVVAVVSQPTSGVKKKPSPVQITAHKLGIPTLCPESAKDPEFLFHLESLNVDLCVTAAYGNFLPKRFLAIPKCGTVNIHPSLLPKYRGAAPVQRCLEHGDRATGVTVLYTVLKMDAGPMITQIPYPLQGDEKAPTVLSDCFKLGTAALVDALPGIFASTIATSVQDEEAKTEAPKLTMEESTVDFAKLSARQIHNKCRGFAEWPGTVGWFQIGSPDSSNPPVQIKIVTTVVLDDTSNPAASTNEVSIVKHRHHGKEVPVLRVVCGDGSVVGIVEVLPPNRRVMSVQDFLNGLKGERRIRWVVPAAATMPGTSKL